ncbi:TetR/AcrR family transcriptional regulator [Jannaschia aquimarina]|uniref:HTH tetR-type domain-containing protein n=1 Tax=Jannaschia aquimarina TaxID=935700 RepID=A0A0D1CQJ0_9RHOB|nr:TetR/AcrR family transcriptional regulator [Jannaschia aquimarina]KIT17052.1 hypothetical protein jaqu_12420 [Jannaschia aquimarina]SNS82334.1 transcriptional regulator, TetR family [Jannaschia aquimarina]
MSTGTRHSADGDALPADRDDGGRTGATARRAPDAKRQAIVDAAERIVADEGIATLKARRLADEAGVALGTPINLFGSIDNVMAAVNARTFDRLADALDAVPRAEDPQEDLTALARAYAGFVSDQPNLWSAVFEGPVGERGTNPNDERVAALLSRLDDRVTASLGQERKAEARILWGAVHGLVSLSVTGRAQLLGLPDLDEAVTALVTRYLWGVRD